MVAITWLADVLRASGVQVVEEGNWQSRTAGGTFNPIGVLWHHTNGPTSSPSNPAPSLSVCINGRTGLPGPLCHALVDFNGVFHVISANHANHAGDARQSGPIPAGSGNTMLIGWEIDYVGDDPVRPDQAMSAAQYDASIKATAAVLKRLGRDASYARGHRETSVTGKIDPSFVDLDAMRADVARRMQGGADRPVIGDWSGEGVADVGVYRPSESRFHLRRPDTTTFHLAWGAPGDIPVTGDWTGDRVATSASTAPAKAASTSACPTANPATSHGVPPATSLSPATGPVTASATSASTAPAKAASTSACPTANPATSHGVPPATSLSPATGPVTASQTSASTAPAKAASTSACPTANPATSHGVPPATSLSPATGPVTASQTSASTAPAKAASTSACPTANPATSHGALPATSLSPATGPVTASATSASTAPAKAASTSACPTANPATSHGALPATSLSPATGPVTASATSASTAPAKAASTSACPTANPATSPTASASDRGQPRANQPRGCPRPPYPGTALSTPPSSSTRT